MTDNIDELLYYDDRVFKYLEDEPCTHPGCRSHISHPCEVCGRQWNIGVDLSSQDDVCVVDSEFIK
jgi:hypothetical protein